MVGGSASDDDEEESNSAIDGGPDKTDEMGTDVCAGEVEATCCCSGGKQCDASSSSFGCGP